MGEQDRQPTPDPAEDNAFFPSPLSLGEYTAPKTDFDGLVDGRYEGGRWKVLVVATEERYMLMQNDTMFSTGNHPVETLLPLHHILEAGYGVDIATPTGAPAKLEWWGYPDQDPQVRSAWERLRSQFKAPRRLGEVVAELDADSDYAAVFVPGGHGAMLGLPECTAVQELLDWALDTERLVVILCHGPAALLAASIGRERSPFAGYSICSFPDALDSGANVDIGYLPGAMPWLLGAALKKDGIVVVNDEMTGATTRDRNVLSGDSPLAANQLGKDTVAALLERFT